MGNASPALYSQKSTVSPLEMPSMPGRMAAIAGPRGNVYELWVPDVGDKAGERH